MTRTVRTPAALAGALLVLLLAAPGAHAQATRTWVSGVGDDVNPCSRTAPCKTYAGAISKTADPGEINALDPGGYGTLTVTKSVTIDGTGTMASTLAAGGISGFIINAPGKTVTLRNLEINGAGTTIGTNGVRIVAAAGVTIENVSIDRFSDSGVRIDAATPVRVLLNGVTIKNAAVGVQIPAAATGAADVQVHDTVISGATAGVRVLGAGDAKVVLDGVSIASPTLQGVQVAPAVGAAPKVVLRNTTITGANPAVQADAGGAAGLLGSLLSFNTLGLMHADGATVEDLGGNTLTNNTEDGTFTKSPPAPPAETVTVTTPAPPPVTTTVTVPVTRVVCAVPNLRGLTLAQARSALGLGRCQTGKVTRRATKRGVGRVLSQGTKAGTQTAEGSAVSLVVGRKAN